jgi:hypothetical protein
MHEGGGHDREQVGRGPIGSALPFRARERLERAASAPGATATAPDRTTSLFVLAIIQIVLGGLFGLMMLTGLFGTLAVLVAQQRSPSLPRFSPTWAYLLYLVPTANLLVTGIGTIKFRPWARRATIISSWIWLGLGVLNVALLTIGLLSGPDRMELEDAIATTTLWALLGFPIGLLVFYRRAGVSDTFARRHAQRTAPPRFAPAVGQPPTPGSIQGN